MANSTFSNLSVLDQVHEFNNLPTSSLLYHLERGQEWQIKYLHEHPLCTRDLESFVDPRKAYYGRYVEDKHEKEASQSLIFDEIETTGCLKELNRSTVNTFSQMVKSLGTIFRYLQMGAAHLGQMSSTSRVLIPFLLQSSDEARRVHLINCLTGLFRKIYANFGDENDAALQPMRKILERLLDTYDFGECLVLLTQIIKPRIDFELIEEISKFCVKNDANKIALLLSTMKDDCLWHQQCAAALMERLCKNKENAIWLDTEIEKWRGVVDSAVALINIYGESKPCG